MDRCNVLPDVRGNMAVFQTMQTGYRKNCSFFQKPEKEINPILI